MKKLNKRGLASLEIIALLTIPGALTMFIIYKIATKLFGIKMHIPKLLLQK